MCTYDDIALALDFAYAYSEVYEKYNRSFSYDKEGLNTYALKLKRIRVQLVRYRELFTPYAEENNNYMGLYSRSIIVKINDAINTIKQALNEVGL